MDAAVELMQSVSTDDPKIASSDEAAPLVQDHVLGLDRYVRGAMQYSHDRFPR
jgi:hypothetical protein